MWPLREFADAAEDFADAAEEAVLLLIRIRNASGRVARAGVTAASIIFAGVRDVASAFAPVVGVIAPVVGVVARILPRRQVSRQERRRRIRDADHEARKRARKALASTSRVHLGDLLELHPFRLNPRRPYCPCPSFRRADSTPSGGNSSSSRV